MLFDELSPVDWEVVGRVSGLGNARAGFEDVLRTRYGRREWNIAHAVVMSGEPMLLNREGFLYEVYVPAMREWMMSAVSWMPQVLIQQASDIFEWLPKDARSYIDTGRVPAGVGFPGQAVAVIFSLMDIFGVERLSGEEEVCVNNKDQRGQAGSVVPADYPEVPDAFKGVLYHTFLSPVLVPVSKEVGIAEGISDLPLVNGGYQQFSDEYYAGWRKDTIKHAAKVGFKPADSLEGLTIEKAFQGSRVLVVEK